ncbi:hypothetical protein IV57_GL000925 [Companilactobacillus kimchiensis]|uniref:Uncharacterized protein n=2 Tax=Companilactobacillus kimchiensis TaxID=993692 RepID=A0A0R2LFB3_9LACO|nr:hypothetical protein IV57_GL000925 [Companilactobacillus kimchiensis]
MDENMDNKLERLTYDQIVAIHLAIEENEEITFSEKRLKSNLEFLNQFEDLELYATHFLCTMICDDIFEKYNVETTIAALDFFLRHNGYCLDLEKDVDKTTILGLIKTIKAADGLKKDDLKNIQGILATCIHPLTEDIE